MTQALIGVQDVSLGGVVPVVLLIALGLVMWVAGQRVLKAALVSAGLLGGAALGWAVGLALDIGIHPAIPTGIGAVGLAAIMALTYRLAVAAALAIVLGVAGPLAVLTVAELQGRYDRQAALESFRENLRDDESAESWPGLEPSIDEFDEWLRPGADERPETAEETGEPEAQSPSSGFTTAVAEVRDGIATLGRALSEWWGSAPDELKVPIGLSAVIGALLGVLLGALSPQACSGVVTASGGSLLWLGGVATLLGMLGVEGWMPFSVRGWLIMWGAVSVLGLAIQWMLRPKATDKSG